MSQPQSIPETPMPTQKINQIKLVLISYVLTFLCGVLVIIPFLVKVPANAYFHSQISRTGFIFSFFMLGMVAFQYLNGFLVKKLSVKTEIVLITLLYLLSLLGLTFIHDIYWVTLPLITFGFCAGVATTLPNFIIVHAFSGPTRSSKLNRVDFFFSAGSFVYPFVATQLLDHHYSWISIYASVLVIFALLNCLLIRTPLPHFEKNHLNEKIVYSQWNTNVIINAFAILFFFLSYIGFTYWIEPYFEMHLHMPVDEANFALSLFWIFYGVGCLLSSFAIKHFQLSKYIIGSLCVALIAYAVIVVTKDVMTLQIALCVLGLGCATVFSSGISFGTHQVRRASPRMVSLFITCSGIGTLIGESLSSVVQARAQFHGVMVMSIVMLLISIALFSTVALHNYFKDSYWHHSDAE
jgi:TsgA-like MFS transporter